LDIATWASVVLAITASVGLLLRMLRRHSSVRGPTRSQNEGRTRVAPAPGDNAADGEAGGDWRVSAFWHASLLELVGGLRALLSMDRTDHERVFETAVRTAAQALRSRFAVIAFLSEGPNGSVYLIGALAEGSPQGRLPLPFRTHPLPTLDNRGILAGVLTEGKAGMLQHDTRDPLNQVGVDCAVAVPLHLPSRPPGVLVVANRPAAQGGGWMPYPRFEGRPMLAYGAPDGQLLQCIARIVELICDFPDAEHQCRQSPSSES